MPQHPWGDGRATEGFSLEAHEPPIPETWENNLFHLINSVPFFLPIPTPCCRSTRAQAPVSGVGGYIYFEIFHLMLFDHPEFLFYELNLSFSSSVLPRWRRFLNYSLIHSTKMFIQHVNLHPASMSGFVRYRARQSLVQWVHSTPAKKKKNQTGNRGFHLLLKNMNRNSIPVYLQIPLGMIWGRGQA